MIGASVEEDVRSVSLISSTRFIVHTSEREINTRLRRLAETPVIWNLDHNRRYNEYVLNSYPDASDGVQRVPTLRIRRVISVKAALGFEWKRNWMQ